MRNMDVAQETVTLKAALAEIPFAQNLNAEELAMLLEHNQFITFSAGETILKQGKVCSGLYLIIEGTALITAKILGEGGTYIATVSRGNLLGEISLLDKGPCVTSALASTQVKCLLMSQAYYHLLGDFFPETKYKITRAISEEVCHRIADLHGKITNFIMQAHMMTRPIFGEVIKSLTTATTTTLKENALDKNDLRNNEFFEIFNDEEFKIVISHSEVLKAPRDCIVLQEDDQEPVCYIVLRGAVQSSIIADNKVAKLSVVGPTTLFCNLTFIDERLPSLINYTTCERSILLKLSGNTFAHIQKNHKALWYKLFDLVCESIVSLERAADKLDIRLNSELYNR